MDRLGRISISAVAILLVLGAGCAGGGSSGRGVAVSERDFSIALDVDTVVEGTVSFRVTNRGPSVHEFLVIGGFHQVDALPVKDGVVNDDAEGVIIQAERDDIRPDTSVTLRVDLTAGDYVLICNRPGHYQRGMRAKLEVEFR